MEPGMVVGSVWSCQVSVAVFAQLLLVWGRSLLPLRAELYSACSSLLNALTVSFSESGSLNLGIFHLLCSIS